MITVLNICSMFSAVNVFVFLIHVHVQTMEFLECNCVLLQLQALAIRPGIPPRTTAWPTRSTFM